VESVTREAFGDGLEVQIVRRMRDLPEYIPELSLVVDDDDRIVGHVLLSRMTFEPDPEATANPRIVAIGPISVIPERQRQGIGSELMNAVIERSRELGYEGIALIGHPWYYPRFGFKPASNWGLRFTYQVPDEAAMALELQPGALEGANGLLVYSSAFAE
jgi:predicted N-acetyltransferase YhbS